MKGEEEAKTARLCERVEVHYSIPLKENLKKTTTPYT